MQHVCLFQACSEHILITEANPKIHRCFCKKWRLCTGVVYHQNCTFVLTSIMVELTSELQEALKWGLLSCLKMQIALQLLGFRLRFWEEQLDVQKMQQNVAWQERGKVFKNTHMSNLYWVRKYYCSAHEISDCIFHTYCTILISKILAWRKWERYHYLFYLLPL